MRISSVNSNQHFTAIGIHDPYSVKKLEKMITSDTDVKKFAKFVKSQEKNNFHIDLGLVSYNGEERLKGYIYNGRNFYRETTELNRSEDSLKPMVFIEKICKIADDISEAYKAKCKESENLYKKLSKKS